jgi:hypothetical protein
VAEELRAAIMEQVKQAPELSVESFETVLDDYVSRVGSLSRTRDELAEIAGGADLVQVDSELSDLRKKRESSPDEKLRAEYERSLEQLEKQRHTYAELLRDRELIEVRLRSAVNTLKQMRIEVARMRGLSDRGGLRSLEELKTRSQELSAYLSDLRRAYEELGE